nr:hypothetical protein L203_01534 [Cryptococcus depauperatus CBS 7841]
MSTYLQLATSSYSKHVIGTISVVVSIMTAVALPFGARLADFASRPAALLMAIVFYAWGYIAAAASNDVTDVAAGEVLYTIRDNSISAVIVITIADITSLQNRGLVQGLYSSPLILTVWISGDITDGINASSENVWHVYHHGAHTHHVLYSCTFLDRLESEEAREVQGPKRTLLQDVIHYWRVMDASGPILLALLGLCCSFRSPSTRLPTIKWKNSSIITMFVVGDWSDKDYQYWLKILTVGLCFFGVIAGLVQKFTHSDAMLVMGSAMISMGGACSVVGSQVATRASVPHADMALAMALLALWTHIGGVIGSAIPAAIRTDQLSKHLHATQINAIYGSITKAGALTEHRDLVQKTYLDTAWYLEVPTLSLCVVPLTAGLYTSSFFLGDSHNAIGVDKNDIMMSPEKTKEDTIKEKAKLTQNRKRMENVLHT